MAKNGKILGIVGSPNREGRTNQPAASQGEQLIVQGWDLRFAANMRTYEGYSIGKLLGLINDPTIISLAGGLPSPDMFLREELQMATRQRFDCDIDRIMQYSPIRGEAELIEAVIAFLKRDGIRVAADNIMITTSGQQGLDLAGRLFLEPGDAVVVERPTFAGALAAFQMQRPIYLGVDLEADGIDVECLHEVLSDCHASGRMPKFIYVVPDFQNPSGVSMSLAKREILLDLSDRFDVPIIEDSPYRRLRYHGTILPSLFSLDQKRGGGRVVGINTFSKLFCPGMRVGFNIGPPEVIDKMTNIKEGSTLNTPKYNQDMCAAFLPEVDLEAYFERCRVYYGDKLKVFLNAMAEYFPAERSVTWTQPEGGMFLWVSMPQNVDTRQLFHTALKFKVAFVPGEAFYGERPERHHIRVNFSYPSKAQLREAVKRLSDCLGQQGI
jgi:2-aminoadipate transaminase